jgi:cytoskeletal protein RodZ
MSGKSRKSKKTMLVKLAVVALLLLTSGLTLAACQQPKLQDKSTEQQKENLPAKSEKKNSDEELKENSTVKSYQKKADKQFNKNQPTKADKKTSEQNKDKAQDSQVDDDPE